MKWNLLSVVGLSGLLVAGAVGAAGATLVSIEQDAPNFLVTTAPRPGTTDVSEYAQTFRYSAVGQDVESIWLDLYLYDDKGQGDGDEKFWLSVDTTEFDNCAVTGEPGSHPTRFSIPTAELSDGELVVTVRAATGDFWFDKSIFTAEVSDEGATLGRGPVSTVPESGTLLLLGSGLLGLAAVGRRMKK